VFSAVFLYALISSVSVDARVVLEGKPLPNQPVLLVSLGGGEARRISEGRTNSSGLAKLELEQSSTSRTFAIATYFEEVPYFGPVFSVDRIPTEPLEIEVFRSLSSSPEVRIRSWQTLVWSRSPNVVIEESFSVLNPTDKVISGELTGEAREVFRISIPRHAFQLAFGEGFQRDALRYEGNEVVIEAPLFPGETYFSMQYSLDKVRYSTSLDKKVSIPVDRIEVASNDSRLRYSMALAATGSRVYRDEVIHLFEKNLDPAQKSWSLSISGFPLNIPVSWFLPLVFLPLIALGFFIDRAQGQGRHSELSEERKLEKRKLLEDLLVTLKMYQQGLLDGREYQMKRLRLIQSLSELYPQSKSSG